MGQNQTMVSQLESIQGGQFNHKRLTLIQPKQFEFQGEWLQATPPHSKLGRWGVTQAKASSQNRKGGLQKDLQKELHKYLHKELQNHYGGWINKWHPPKH